MSLTPEKLHEAARLIASTAKEAETKGMSGHAQQLTDRAGLVKSWAKDMARYQADGVELTPAWTRYIEGATAEFLAFAGHPQQERDRGTGSSAREKRRRPVRQSERVR